MDNKPVGVLHWRKPNKHVLRTLYETVQIQPSRGYANWPLWQDVEIQTSDSGKVMTFISRVSNICQFEELMI